MVKESTTCSQADVKAYLLVHSPSSWVEENLGLNKGEATVNFFSWGICIIEEKNNTIDSYSSTMWGCGKKSGICKSQREASLDAGPVPNIIQFSFKFLQHLIKINKNYEVPW